MTIKVTSRFYKTIAFLLAVLSGLTAGACVLGALYFAATGHYDNRDVTPRRMAQFENFVAHRPDFHQGQPY